VTKRTLTLSSPQFTLDAILNPAIILDNDGVYTHCNQPYLDVIGMSLAEVLGRTDSEILPAKEAEIHNQANQFLLSLQSKYIAYEIPFQEPASDVLGMTKVSKSVVTASDGQITGFIAIFSLNNRSYYLKIRKLFNLTNQEANVLFSSQAGLPVKGIARALNISTHTVDGHMKIIYQKMGVKSCGELNLKIRILKQS